MHKNGLRACLWLAAANIAFNTTVDAQDLFDLSIEELIELDVFAPAVLSSHIHRKGDRMIGYEFMYMDMDGNRDGTTRLASSAVLQDFPITPTSMSMDMHMLHVMYAPTDDITVMAMLRRSANSMSHLTRLGMRFDTESSGFGDIDLMVHQRVAEREGENVIQRFTAKYGLSIPTGSINRSDFVLPMNATARLPYSMQLGSGTYDVLSGFGYLGYGPAHYWGAQIDSVRRTGRNDQGYRLGHRFALSAFGAKIWNDSLSTVLRLDIARLGNIDGADPLLNPMMAPTADPDRRAGTSAYVGFTVDMQVAPNARNGQALSLTVERPLYLDLSGPQLEVESIIRFGWQVGF